MRLRDIDIEPETNILEIDIMKLKRNFAIVVSEGRARLTKLPAHGETKMSHIKAK